jgi:LacI family transcriptional regulator
MPITLKELSRRAGVHPSTVARVLHNDPRQRVSEQVRERILRLAEELRYRPNSLARSLRTRRSAVLGALIPDIANPFFASVLRGIEDVAAERDYSVILANTDDLPAREARGLEMMRGRQVDGLLLATARRQDVAIASLLEERLPFVLVNRHTDPITPNAVVFDDYAGGCAAVEHLLALGHRRIAHISGSDEISTAHLRRQGYRDTLAWHGIEHDPALEAPGNFREAGGYEAMQRLLTVPDPPTAVFAVNDLAAAGALNALAEAGLRVPEDVSVIGFNDIFQRARLSPQLSSVQAPSRALGTQAAERLLAMIIDDVWPDTPLLLPVTLVARDTTGPAPAPRRGTYALPQTHER